MSSHVSAHGLRPFSTRLQKVQNSEVKLVSCARKRDYVHHLSSSSSLVTGPSKNRLQMPLTHDGIVIDRFCWKTNDLLELINCYCLDATLLLLLLLL